ncbi:hypothetical protein WA158_001298 [Blastocystis sp. Blastoise]
MENTSALFEPQQRINDNLLDKQKTFHSNEFSLDRRLVKALSNMGFNNPTVVQSQCIPLVLEGKDLLVRANTGSGKTIAYGIPILQKLISNYRENNESSIKVLILTPSRELCLQTKEVFKSIMRYINDLFSCEVIEDGDVDIQKARLSENPDILISTPFLVQKYLNMKVITLKDIQTLVIDEADLTLSYGYEEDMKIITNNIPSICQSIFMSATLNDDINKLRQGLLTNPVVVKIEEEQTKSINQYYVSLKPRDEDILIFVLIKLNILQGKILFFVNNIDRCYYLKLFFEQFSIPSAVLNSELPVKSRENIIHQFNKGKFDFLIATDESMLSISKKKKEEDDDEEDNSENDLDLLESEEEKEEEEEEDNSDNNSEKEMKIEEEEEEEEEKEKDVDDKKNSKKEEEEEEKEYSDDDMIMMSEDSEEEDKSDNDNEKEEEENSDELPDFNYEFDLNDIKEEENKKKQQNKKNDETEYDVSRGIDFKNVSCVINFDFPLTKTSYIHRIGRTARAGNTGIALSFIHDNDEGATTLLHTLQNTLPLNNGVAQPSPLPFNMKEIESFRYRVEDVRRAVTRIAIKESRIKEIQQELFNNTVLQSHFEDNPQELNLLHHARPLLPRRVKAHLRDVPDYLLPEGLKNSVTHRATAANGSRKNIYLKKKKNDPLQSFAMTMETLKSAPRASVNTSTGERVLSGRNRWKLKHHKGNKRNTSKKGAFGIGKAPRITKYGGKTKYGRQR